MPRLAFEPKELERTEERLFALAPLARKHKVAVDDLPALSAGLKPILPRSTRARRGLPSLPKPRRRRTGSLREAAALR